LQIKETFVGLHINIDNDTRVVHVREITHSHVALERLSEEDSFSLSLPQKDPTTTVLNQHR